MQPDYMRESMKNLESIWSRPINLVTVIEGQPKLVRYDGREFNDINLQDPQPSPESEKKSS